MSRPNASVVLINAALDEFFDYQRRTHGTVVGRRFTRNVIARCAQRATGTRPTRPVVSHALQQYRLSQGNTASTNCLYRIAARGYARSALWYVMDGPGLDPLDGEAMTLAHVEWVTRDLAKRAASDAVRELIPAAAQHPTIQSVTASTIKAIEANLVQMIDRARAEADFYEQVTAREVTVVPALTSDEQDLIANLNGGTP